MGPISQLDAAIRGDVIGSPGGVTGSGVEGADPGSGGVLGVDGGGGTGEADPEPLLPPQLWAESDSPTVITVRMRRAELYFGDTSLTQRCVRSNINYSKCNRVRFDSSL
jgi:hypothetical protein